MIGRAVFLAFVLITVVAFLIPNEYESVARLIPPDKQQLGGLATMLAVAGTTGGGASSGMGGILADSLGVKSSGALYMGFLKSSTLQDALVSQFDLRKVYGKRYRVDARKELSENTAISEDRKSDIITLTVTDHSPERAQQLASAYATILNQLTAQLDTSAAHRERVFIGGRLEAVRKDLEVADKNLSEFSSKNLTLDVKEQGKAMMEGAAELEGQLIAAESQLSGLQQIYTPDNVRIRSLQARVDLLKKKLSQLRGNRSEPFDARAAQDATNLGSGDDVGISISQLPVLGVTYYDLYRQAKVQETLFEVLTKQYELAKVEEAKELPTVKVLDNPEIPEKKSGPPRLSIIAIGTLLAFCAAVGWVWADYRWGRVSDDDPRKATIAEVRRALSIVITPTLARVWLALRGIARRDATNQKNTL